MALVGDRWFAVFNLIDNGRNQTSKRFELAVADAAAAATLVASLVTNLNAVTDAVIVSYFYYREFVEDSLSLPASGVQVEDVALWLFDIVDHPQKTATLAIPAPAPGIFQTTTGAGANIVDTNDAAVIALRDMYLDGDLLISDGEVAASLISGRRIHRASRRG